MPNRDSADPATCEGLQGGWGQEAGPGHCVSSVKAGRWAPWLPALRSHVFSHRACMNFNRICQGCGEHGHVRRSPRRPLLAAVNAPGSHPRPRQAPLAMLQGGHCLVSGALYSKMPWYVKVVSGETLIWRLTFL